MTALLYALSPLALIVFACFGSPWTAIAVATAIGYIAVVNEVRHRPQGRLN
jgi:hypothetical protein